MTTQEEWKDITGFEGRYQISDFGRIQRTYKNGKKIIMKQETTNTGYLRIRLQFNHFNKKFLVHRLVAQEFLDYDDDDEKKICVDHKDGDKTNNHVSNLRYCTHSQNNQNKKIIKTNTSGHKNVYWRKERKHWAVRLHVNGKLHYIGSSKDYDTACQMCDSSLKSLHGEFYNNN